VGKIAGNSTNFCPHLNCCDPDVIHVYSPRAFRWTIKVSDIDSVKKPNGSAKLTGPPGKPRRPQNQDDGPGLLQPMLRPVEWVARHGRPDSRARSQPNQAVLVFVGLTTPE
jgi:hypothetical protein